MLEIKNLSKTYKGGVKAVSDLSLTVLPGQIFGFIGANGSGKTTTIRSIVGTLDFDEGEILICGKSIKKDPLECKKLIAYTPDNPDLYDFMTGMQYLSFVCNIFGVSDEARKARIEKYADIFEIKDRLPDPISSYSHGMKQKIAIISSLIHDPKLFIMDEPFVGLDPKASFSFKEMMREFCAQGGAIFFSTHVLEVAEKLCTHIGIIKNGHLAACGETEAVCAEESLEEIFLELDSHE